MKAQFGQLGLIDVHFTPTKTLLTVPPPKGYKGEPTTYREGFFAGTIEFTGEREYVHFDKVRVDGKMNVNRQSEWRCPRHGGSRSLRSASRASATTMTRAPRRRTRRGPSAAITTRPSCVATSLTTSDFGSLV